MSRNEEYYSSSATATTTTAAIMESFSSSPLLLLWLLPSAPSKVNPELSSWVEKTRSWRMQLRPDHHIFIWNPICYLGGESVDSFIHISPIPCIKISVMLHIVKPIRLLREFDEMVIEWDGMWAGLGVIIPVKRTGKCCNGYRIRISNRLNSDFRGSNGFGMVKRLLVLDRHSILFSWEHYRHT